MVNYEGEFLMNMWWYSFLASVFVIGSITGALVGGITGEKLGRRSALMIDNVIMIVGKILSLNVQDVSACTEIFEFFSLVKFLMI